MYSLSSGIIAISSVEVLRQGERALKVICPRMKHTLESDVLGPMRQSEVKPCNLQPSQSQLLDHV
jgi:hypothetical protein